MTYLEREKEERKKERKKARVRRGGPLQFPSTSSPTLNASTCDWCDARAVTGFWFRLHVTRLKSASWSSCGCCFSPSVLHSYTRGRVHSMVALSLLFFFCTFFPLLFRFRCRTIIMLQHVASCIECCAYRCTCH